MIFIGISCTCTVKKIYMPTIYVNVKEKINIFKTFYITYCLKLLKVILKN